MKPLAPLPRDVLDALASALAAAIVDLIDQPMWERSLGAEEAEAASLKTVLDRWTVRRA